MLSVKVERSKMYSINIISLWIIIFNKTHNTELKLLQIVPISVKILSICLLQTTVKCTK